MGRPRGSKNVVPKTTQWDCGPVYGHYVGSLVSRSSGYVNVVGVNGNGKHVALHTIIVETAIGRKLPLGALVHHVNEVKSDNRNNNLCALQNCGEHVELHRKMVVRAAGGDPWKDRMCCSCGPRPIEEFYVTAYGGGRLATECRACARARALARIAANRDAINAQKRARYHLQVLR